MMKFCAEVVKDVCLKLICVGPFLLHALHISQNESMLSGSLKQNLAEKSLFTTAKPPPLGFFFFRIKAAAAAAELQSYTKP